MNVIYFHAGADTLEESFVERGHTFHSITLTKSFEDIPYYNHETGFDTERMWEELGSIDAVFASPDCRSYSPAAVWKYKRTKENGYTTTVEHGVNCDKFNRFLWRAIDEINPLLYFVENPRGRMKFMDFVQGKPCYEITYCMYGAAVRKPTNIFTNHPNPKFKRTCKKSDGHTHILVAKQKDPYERSMFPKELCEHLVDLCEEYDYENEGDFIMTKQIYNKTQLTPQQEFEKHIYHRDQFAHYLRWSHILKVLQKLKSSKQQDNVKLLDFGCGTGEMLDIFYRNRCKLGKYLGLDIRDQTVKNNCEKFNNIDFAEFKQADLCAELDLGETFDIITCFEVIEHIGHDNADTFLDNIAFHCNSDTRVYLSTPNYDPKVGAAANHMLGPDKELGEWDHFELHEKLSEYFDIEEKYGTFASIKDYKEEIATDWRQVVFEELKKYYDSEMLSVIMAPLVKPEHARNCLWVLKVKQDYLDSLE